MPKWVLTLGLTLCVLTASLQAQTVEELYQQVFGTPPPNRYQELEFFVIIDEQKTETLSLSVNTVTQQFKLSKNDFFSLIQTEITKVAFAELKEKSRDLSYFDNTSLEKLGFTTTLRIRTQEFRLGIPPEIRDKISISISKNPFLGSAGINTITPSKELSGFINFRPRFTFQESGQSNTLLGFDSKTTLKEWTLEAQGFHNSSNPDLSLFNSVRLIHDNESEDERLSIGSLPQPYSVGFSRYTQLLGIGLHKEWSLDPEFDSNYPYTATLILEKDAQVRIRLNEQTIRTITLKKGHYELKDFPFTDGLNRIYIEATHKNEIIHRFTDTFITDYRLLRENKSEYAAQIGLNEQFDSPLMPSNEFGSLLYYRYGLTSGYTAGAYLQSNQYTLLGLQHQLATTFGLLEWDIGVSHLDTISDFGTMFQLSSFSSGSNLRLFDQAFVDFSVYGRDFISAPQTGPHTIATEVGIGGNLNFSRKYKLSIRAFERVLYDHSSQPRGISVGLSAYIQSFIIQSRYEYTLSPENEDETRAIIQFSYLPKTHRIEVRQDLESKSTNLNLTYRPNTEDELSLNSTTGLSNDYLLETRWQRNRFQTSLTQRRQNNLSSLQSQSSYRGPRGFTSFSTQWADGGIGPSSFSHDFAVAFSEGKVAISKPIQNNFAIIYTEQDLEGFVLFGDSRLDKWSPAVIADMQAYRLNSVAVTDFELDEGLDFETQRFYFRPRYGSGTTVKVLSEPSIRLEGTLQERNGSPISLLGGELISESTNTSHPFFTNREGHFQIIGVKTGTYLIRLNSPQFDNKSITIPAKKTGQVDLGNLTITTK